MLYSGIFSRTSVRMSSPFREEMPASLVARSPAKTSQDRYRCIAGLDQQLDNINWENMTEVITEPEHCSNMDAVEFIQVLLCLCAAFRLPELKLREPEIFTLMCRRILLKLFLRDLVGNMKRKF